MYVRTFVVMTVLAGGCLSSACGGAGNGVTTPTAPGGGGPAASEQSRENPPPSSVPPSPPSPPVEREPSPPGSPSPPPPPSSGSCDSTKAKFAIGQPATDDLLERARVAAGAGVARFLRPNQPITMEYSGARLNLNLTGADVVSGAYCG